MNRDNSSIDDTVPSDVSVMDMNIGFMAVSIGPTVADEDELVYRKGFCDDSYGLSEQENADYDVGQQGIPLPVEGIVNLSQYGGRSVRAIPFSMLPSHVLHEMGVTGFFASGTHVHNQEEEKLLEEHGFGTSFGENPRYHSHKDFRL